MTEWFTNPEAGVLGAILGGSIGIVGGGIGGPLMGYFVPKGRAKTFILGFLWFWFILGVALIITGIVAITQSQPYHVYYPFLFCGGIASVVMGPLIPVIARRYRAAEQRRLAAEEFRRS
jgi:MFS family permease